MHNLLVVLVLLVDQTKNNIIDRPIERMLKIKKKIHIRIKYRIQFIIQKYIFSIFISFHVAGMSRHTNQNHQIKYENGWRAREKKINRE